MDSNSDTEFSSAQGYYQGRILRIKNWKKLQADVLSHFSKHTVILFLTWYYELCCEITETERLPGDRLMIQLGLFL